MNNLNDINKQKLNLIKGLTAKEIRSASLKLWKEYYNNLILKMNIKKADSYLKQIEFISKNADPVEWSKINKADIRENIEMMPIELAIDLRFDTIKLSKNLINASLFSVYQKLETFNKMFSIMKDSLNTLNNDQSIDLAIEIASCELLIEKVINSDIKSFKTDTKLYNCFLKEKEIFISTINSTTFSEDIHNYMEIFKNKVNKKLVEKKN